MLNLLHESITHTIHHLCRDINMWNRPEHPHIMIVMSRPISATASPTNGKDAEDLMICPHDHQIESHLTFPCELPEACIAQHTAHRTPTAPARNRSLVQAENLVAASQVSDSTSPTVPQSQQWLFQNSYTRFTNASAECN
jgi:hypothetical protein